MAPLVDDMLLLAQLDEQRPLDGSTVDLGVSASTPAPTLVPSPIASSPWTSARACPSTATTTVCVRWWGTSSATTLVHTPEGTAVTVQACTTAAAAAVVEVHDDGPGMEPDVTARTSSGSSRPKRARSRNGEIALGLAIVQAIVVAHNGRVHLTSGPRRGNDRHGGAAPLGSPHGEGAGVGARRPERPSGRQGPPRPARSDRASRPGRQAQRPGAQRQILGTLDDLHNRLWAEAKRSVVLVLQGMDASGKDGTIRRVLSGLNPQGCAVVNFKVPTELDARPRLPLAGARHAPGPGDPRRDEPLALRGRRRRADPRRHRRRALRAALPPHPGVRADAHRRGHHGGEGLPPHLEGGAARPAPGPHRRPGEELEVPHAPTSRSGRSGTTTRSATRRRSPRRPPTGRRGTWCRATTSGCATSPSPRCSSTCSPDLDPQIPEPEPGLDGSSWWSSCRTFGSDWSAWRSIGQNGLLMDVESRDSVSLKPAELDELGQLASGVGLPCRTSSSTATSSSSRSS